MWPQLCVFTVLVGQTQSFETSPQRDPPFKPLLRRLCDDVIKKGPDRFESAQFQDKCRAYVEGIETCTRDGDFDEAQVKKCVEGGKPEECVDRCLCTGEKLDAGNCTKEEFDEDARSGFGSGSTDICMKNCKAADEGLTKCFQGIFFTTNYMHVESCRYMVIVHLKARHLREYAAHNPILLQWAMERQEVAQQRRVRGAQPLSLLQWRLTTHNGQQGNSVLPARGFCGACCIEDCKKDGNSFMECMDLCATPNPKWGWFDMKSITAFLP